MDRSDLYWQSRLRDLERRLQRVEAELQALKVDPTNNGEFYTVKQFAKALGVCELTIRRRCQEGSIRAYKSGQYWRIPKDELQKIYEA